MKIDQHKPEASIIPSSLMRVETSPRVSTFVSTLRWFGTVSTVAALVLLVLRSLYLYGVDLRVVLSVLGASTTLATVGLILGRVLRSNEVLGPGEVRLGGGRVTLVGEAGSTSFRLDKIISGAESPLDQALSFELRDGRRVWVRPREARDREALLRATCTSVEQRAGTLRLQGRVGPGLVAAGHFILAAGLLAALWVVAAKRGVLVGFDLVWAAELGILMSAAFGAAMSQVHVPRIVVGMDGLRIRRSFRERFVPFDEIVDFEAEQTGAPGRESQAVVIATRSLGRIALPVAGMSMIELRSVKARIDEAIAAAERARSNAGFAHLFERKGRTVGAWREDLRSLVSSEGGYRTATLTRENAEAVLGDPSRSTEQKVGAALALGVIGAGRGAEEARSGARLRIAPSAYADAASQRALAAALEDEDAALEEALEDIRRKGLR